MDLLFSESSLAARREMQCWAREVRLFLGLAANLYLMRGTRLFSESRCAVCLRKAMLGAVVFLVRGILLFSESDLAALQKKLHFTKRSIQ